MEIVAGVGFVVLPISPAVDRPLKNPAISNRPTERRKFYLHAGEILAGRGSLGRPD